MVRCIIAALTAALTFTVLFDNRWRRMRRQLIDGAEQHLRDADGPRGIDSVDRELAAGPATDVADALLDERLSIQGVTRNFSPVARRL